MRYSILYPLLCFALCKTEGFSQDHVAVASGTHDGINIKWFARPLVSSQGYRIYRQKKGDREWAMISQDPVKFKTYNATEQELSDDKDLRNYILMVSDTANLRGIAVIAVLVKSFHSEPLCRFLGITFNDLSAKQGEIYKYKVTRVSGEHELEVAQSAWVKSGVPNTGLPPEDPEAEVRRRNVMLRWKPEPFRYFAAHIFRKIGDTGVFRKITSDPVLISQTAGGQKNEKPFYFEDRNLPQRIAVVYVVEGVDFFGRPTERSKPVRVFVRDDEAPAQPDSIYKRLNGKKAAIHWRKKHLEEDLAGFNVYRTTRNDTDYRQINKKLLPRDSIRFVDLVPEFGGYFYIIAAVDGSGNESLSSPYFVDVFDNEPPAVPRGITAVADSVTIRLRWKEKSDDAAGYLLYRTINGDNPDTYVKLTPRAVQCCGFNDTMPANIRNKVFYKLVAVDVAGNRSGYSEPVSVRLPDLTPPSKPFVTTGRYGTDNSVCIEWMKNPDPDLMVYQVFSKRCDDSSSAGIRVGESVTNRFEHNKNHKPGTYAFWVVAVDSSRLRSQPSNTVFVRCPAARERAVSRPVLSGNFHPGKREVHLKWQCDEKDLRGVVVFRSTGGKPYLPLTGLLAEKRLADSHIIAGEEYSYQLKAYKMNGDVLRSEILTIKTNSENENN